MKEMSGVPPVNEMSFLAARRALEVQTRAYFEENLLQGSFHLSSVVLFHLRSRGTKVSVRFSLNTDSVFKPL